MGKNWRRNYAARGSKYRNIRVKTSDGTFDSKGEMRRWLWLRELERRGELRDLRRQIKYSIDINGHHICDYVADFVFICCQSGLEVVEDFKGHIITGEFKLKKKMLRALYGIDVKIVKEVTAPIN